MDQIRQWYPHLDADLAAVRRFWAGEGRYLVSVNTNNHYYRQTFDDAAVLAAAPHNLQALSQLPGCSLPTFFADWGTVTTAKYWGGEAHFDSTGGNIFIDPVAETLDEGLALTPRPVDDPEMDGARALRLFHQLQENLGSDALWLRTPDMQGPLNTAGLILNQEQMMIAMYEDKAKLHAFLEKVVDFLVEYALYLRRESGNRVCGNIWPYTFYPGDLGVAFTEDLMPLLSTRMYKEFGIPLLRRLSASLGGLHIHCCGDWGRHARSLAESGLPIQAVEFHHPDTTIEELEPLDRQTVLIPYLMMHKTDQFQSVIEYYRHLLDRFGSRRRFWFALTDDTPEMLAFAREISQKNTHKNEPA
jgi:hypothetical protein